MISRYDNIRLNTASYNKTRLKSADRHTRASALAKTYVNTKENNQTLNISRELFKMKKFHNVAPRTNTHLSTKQRAKLNKTMEI